METYFANLTGDELLGELTKRIDEYTRIGSSRPFYWQIIRALRYYYGQDEKGNSAALMPYGDRGELSRMNFNLTRRLTRQMITLVAGANTSYKVQPVNTDASSREDAILGEQLLESYKKFLKLNRNLFKSAELGYIFGESFVWVRWDVTAGQNFMVDDLGQQVKTGDVSLEVLPLPDCIYDPYAPTPDVDWRICVRRVNRYDLAARYPEKAEKILAQQTLKRPEIEGWSATGGTSGMRSDQLEEYTFYHKATPAVPEGMECVFTRDTMLIPPCPLAYDSIPVYRFAPESYWYGPFGYSPIFDILGIAEALNDSLSAILSNQRALGVQHVVQPKGNDIEPNMFSGGLNVLEYALAKPEPLNLVQSAPELFQAVDMYQTLATTSMGMNEAFLGNPSNRMPASAMALLGQKVAQYAESAQEAFQALQEDVGHAIIRLLQSFAGAERVAEIVGENNGYMLKTFTRDDLRGISRVTVESIAPAAKLFEMRFEMANQFLASGALSDINQYLDFVATGQTPKVMTGAVMQETLISEENSALLTGGKPVRALLTDNHPNHIMAHRQVLDNLDARFGPQVEAVLAHIQEHIQLFMTTDPTLLQALGMNPAANAQMVAAQSRSMPDPSQGQVEEAGAEQQAAAEGEI